MFPFSTKNIQKHYMEISNPIRRSAYLKSWHKTSVALGNVQPNRKNATAHTKSSPFTGFVQSDSTNTVLKDITLVNVVT